MLFPRIIDKKTRNNVSYVLLSTFKVTTNMNALNYSNLIKALRKFTAYIFPASTETTFTEQNGGII